MEQPLATSWFTARLGDSTHTSTAILPARARQKLAPKCGAWLRSCNLQVTLQTVMQEPNVAAALLVAWQRTSSFIKEVLGDLGDLLYLLLLFIWGPRTLTPTGSAAASGFHISGLYRLIWERGVWFVVLGGGRGRGSCALLERSLLAADSGGTVPDRTEVARALHSLLWLPHTFLFFSLAMIVSFCMISLYSYF